MQALVVTEWGSMPDLVDQPERDPAPGEISVRIEACGLNFADLLMVEGTYQEKPDLPFIPGMELAGTVRAAGEGVDLAPGARVAIVAGRGGLAEMGCFPAKSAVCIHDSLSSVEAAGFQVAYGTSHVALAHRARLKPGETLLVLGAAGGVGLTAVEIGRLMGARVIAVARGADRLAVAEKAGAHHLIDSATADLRAELKALGGVDVVYDPVGGTGFDAAFRAVRPEGRIVVIGFASGDVPQIKANHLLVKNIDVMGFYWGGYRAFRPEVIADSMKTLLAWHSEGKLHPHVSHTFPLAQANEALELLRSRKATGKIVVTM